MSIYNAFFALVFLVALFTAQAVETTTFVSYCSTVEAADQVTTENTLTDAIKAGTFKQCYTASNVDTNFGWACAPEVEGKCRNGEALPLVDRAAWCVKVVTTTDKTCVPPVTTITYIKASDQGKCTLPETEALASLHPTTPPCVTTKKCPYVIRRNKVLDANLKDIHTTGSTVFIAGGHTEIGQDVDWVGDKCLLPPGPLELIFNILTKLKAKIANCPDIL